jgi:2-haloacid dehalogenase
VAGLARLKAKYVIAPCSNGNIALIVEMAKRAGLPWDVVLGAEPARAYKPMPEAYLASCRMLDLAPEQVLMVAAHNFDLDAARACGLRTAFVPRPTERDVAAGPGVDLAVDDFLDLAERLAC